MNTYAKISPAYLARAQHDSQEEANAWPRTALASWTLRLIDELEVKSDELAGIAPYGDEPKSDIAQHITNAIHDLKLSLGDCRTAAIADAAQGYDDGVFEEELERDTITVEQALANARRPLWPELRTQSDPMVSGGKR